MLKHGFMKRRPKLTTLFYLLFFTLLAAPALAQEKFTLSGTVAAQRTGEKLPSATITVKGRNAATFTNEYGFYSLTLSKGTYTIEYSAVGLAMQTITLTLDKNQTQDISLANKEQDLEGVVVVTKKSTRSSSNPQMGVERLSI